VRILSTKTKAEKIYPLSPLQEGMLFHKVYDDSSTAYFNQTEMDIEGIIDLELMGKSLNRLIERHDVLRTVFVYQQSNHMRQVVLSRRKSRIRYEDISHLSSDEQRSFIREYRENEKQKGFDLSKDILFRMSIFQTGEKIYQMIISYHHMIMDGWCQGILFQELLHIYASLKRSQAPQLEPAIPYSRYINFLKTKDKEEGLAFWQERLTGYTQQAALPQRQALSEKRGYQQSELQLIVDEKLTQQLKDVARESRITLNTLMQTLWGVVLQKYTGLDDVVFGAVVSGRTPEVQDIENMIGLTINTVPVRVTGGDKKSFRQLASEVQQEAFSAEPYEYLPLYDIQSRSELQQGLFNHIFIFENYPMDATMFQNAEDVGFEILDMQLSEQTNYDFNIMVIPGEQLTIKFMFNHLVYEQEMVSQLKEHVRHAIWGIVSHPEKDIEDIEIVTEQEKRKLLVEFNNTQLSYPKEKLLHQLFEEQVEERPDSTALVFGEQELTYKELNEKANQLARVLRAQGVQADTIVGLMVERSLEMMIGLFAILKAGGTYLPIDPTYPAERMNYLLEDSQVKLVLSHQLLLAHNKLPEQIEVIYIEDESHFEETDKENLPHMNSSNDVAYIIYTSGSTGKPKGILTTHFNISRVVKNTNYIDITSEDILLQLSNYAFDGSTFDIFGALLNGAKLVLLNKDEVSDMSQLTEIIAKYENLVFFITTALFNTLVDTNVDKLANIRKVLVGGEKLSIRHVQKALACLGPNKIMNVYGPTESTVFATSYPIHEITDDVVSIPIGKPISNTQTIVLDKYGKIVPIGVPGELCISGEGLARGYLNRPELTLERFVDHPYFPRKKMYKTGDLVRWLPDGNIQFLGRMDYQVKIRGFRIELGEIEAQLMQNEQIIDTVVLARQDQGEGSYLCAYLVAKESLNVSDIRTFLAKQMPEYMIPAFFVQLEQLPLTQNGKVDRKALPAPDGSLLTGVEYRAAHSEVEKQLVTIWQAIVGVKSIGTLDNFFEIGGHSLRAATLAIRINKTFGVQFPLRELFLYPTIQAQANYIEQASKDAYEEIPLLGERDYYPVSSAQKRLYFLQQLEEAGIAYNIPGVFRVEGPLDQKRLKHALDQLIARHESLRTSFSYVDEQTVQRVQQHASLPIEKINLEPQDKLHLLEHPKKLESIVERFIRPFDLNQSPLMRVALVQLTEETHLLLFDMHHIISDGVSMTILVQEIVALYAGKGQPALRIQYKDYAAWQQANFQGEGYADHEQYWLSTFASELPVLQLPTDYSRPAVQSFEGQHFSVEVNNDLTKAIQKIVKENETTLYTFLLAAYTILLSKYTGQDDIIVGTPVAGRSHVDVEPLIGMFVNTVALRNKPSSNKTFEQFLQEVKDNALSAFEYQDYPLEELIEKLDASRDTSRNPLFDVMFVLQNMDQAELEVEGLTLTPYSFTNPISKFDLTLTATELEKGIHVQFEYRTRLFKPETIERMAGHFTQILQQIVEAPSLLLQEIEMVSEEEKQQLFIEFNDTKASYPKEKLLHQLFEEQVEKRPNSTALVFEEQELTYRELNEKANQVARELRAKGVSPDQIIALMLDRSPEMIVGILAILKAGGAYLPIDPSYPLERIQFMLEDSGAKHLLTDSTCLNELLSTEEEVDQHTLFHGELIWLDQMETNPKNTKDTKDTKNNDNIEPITVPSHLAYIIYTSGTTGKPKGVMIEHRNVVRLLFNDKPLFDFDEEDVWTMFHSYCFDFSVWEMYGALLNGGKLVIVPKTVAQDPGAYADLLVKEQVTVLNQTPSAFYALSKEVCNEQSDRQRNNQSNQQKRSLQLRYVIFGGEALMPAQLKPWRVSYPDCQLINMYGITETTVHVTYKEIGDHEIEHNISNIGKPIPTLQVYVLDQHKEPVPIGVTGELYVGGEGVARGYLNRSELTKERFVAHPFTPGEVLYRSGDLVRWLSDGNMEYVGRMDHQVKIRGFRIELGEIEHQLMAYEAVKETVVIHQVDTHGDDYLCAYVVTNEELNVEELRSHLSSELPFYMVPSFFVQLEKMPLTSNGKLDRKALPLPDGSLSTGVEYRAPHSKVEKQLATIWQELLGVEPIGTLDNFFEVGGHSLKAATLAMRIAKTFDVKLPLRDLFIYSTIQEQADFIERSNKEVYQEIPLVDEREYYPVSSAQKRLYVLQRFEEAGITYNTPAVFMVEGPLDLIRLEKVLNQLILRHESLRTTFSYEDKMVVQRVHQSIAIQIAEIPLEIQGQLHELEYLKELQTIVKDFIQPFDLSQAPLMRVGIVRISEEKHLLLFDMHHIISDGISMMILVQEMGSMYVGGELPALRIQYKDYAVWQQANFQGEGYALHEQYWLNSFEGELPMLQLPTDYARPAVQSFEGDHIAVEINASLTKAIQKVARENNTTVYAMLLAGYNILLSKYSGQEDIIVGTPVAGRGHVDVEPIIGMFINTLALRNQPKRLMTAQEFLQEVTGNMLQAFEHQDYPLEELIERVQVPRDLSRNPLFDTMFVLQNQERNSIELDGLAFRPYDFETQISKFDLMVVAVEEDDKILLTIEYASKLFKPETVKQMGKHYLHILEQMTADLNQPIAGIELGTAEEKQQLLVEFNDHQVDFPRVQPIHEQFEQQVLSHPEQMAVKHLERSLTYQELNEKSNQLARVLQNKGVQPNRIVGLMVERSPEMMIGMMAILKAGGAYLPIDPTYPQERIQYVLEDSKTSILLMQKEEKGELSFGGECIYLEDGTHYQGDASNVKSSTSAEDLMYVIYTSGSTGKPKGVLVPHRSFHNFAYTLYTHFNQKIEPQDRFLSLTNISFDVSVCELFVPMLFGATLVLYPDPMTELNTLTKLIIDESITFAYIPPTILKEVSRSLQRTGKQIGLNKMLVGVEPIKDETLEAYVQLNPDIQIVNGYGPTETTICSTMYVYRSKKPTGQNVPIGKPLFNTRSYILDQSNHPVPVGVAGELCIAGLGLAHGYLNQPEMTEQKFVSDPFVSGEKMYRTGDLAKWLPNGNIMFLGRADDQVKIKGYRIELGEIESHLLTCDGVKEALVMAPENDKGYKELVAYYVTEDQEEQENQGLEASSIRVHLLQQLPEYMIPAFFIELNEMPLTPNGKIDRKALPQPTGASIQRSAYVAPTNELEETLAEIWEDVLGIEQVGIQDNYYTLGGDSIKALHMLYRLQAKEIPVQMSDLLQYTSIKELTSYLQSKNREHQGSLAYESIPLVEEREHYPVPSAQKRLYFLQQLEEAGIVYNMPAVFTVEGALNIEKLAGALRQLIERHESLRTSFQYVDEETVQFIHPKIAFEIEELFLEESENLEDPSSIVSRFVRPFTLSQAPLLRVGLVRITEEKHLLLFDMHHIISDGVSMMILVQEMASLYAGKELPVLRIQYKDYAVWQEANFQGEGYLSHEQYWLRTFAGELPVLQLPTDYARPAVQNFEGQRLGVEIDEALTQAIKQIAIDNGTTLYTVLLAGYTTLLSKYSGQEDIIVGTPVAGRSHGDVGPLIGMFVNTLALRNQPNKTLTCNEFIQTVKKNTLDAFEHQEYPLEEIIERVDVQRDLSRNPLFDTMLVLQNMEKHSIEVDGLTFYSHSFEGQVSKFDLTFTAIEDNHQIFLDIKYGAKLFIEETVERMATHFLHILEQMTVAPDQTLADIELVTEEEKQQLLYDFNPMKTLYPSDLTIIELFEKQVEIRANQIAVVFGNNQLTYQDLNTQANKLAFVLRKKGVRANQIVGLMIERSTDMFVGMMAILKAGGAYLPIDPTNPIERIQYLLEDSEASIVLTNPETLALMNSSERVNATEAISRGKEIVYINETERAAQTGYLEEDISNLASVNQSSDLAYVIYTSGTTGKPKGVLIEHRNVMNLIEGLKKEIYIHYREPINMALIAPYVFDASVKQIFAAFLLGHSLFVVDEETRMNGKELVDFYYKHQIILSDGTPAHLALISEAVFTTGTEVETLDVYPHFLLGGDHLSKTLVEKFATLIERKKIKITNVYGPTECTVDTTVFHVEQMENIKSKSVVPIGKPLPNVQAYILNESLHLQPIGAIGELCISGEGLSRGYLNQQELTKDKFIENPFKSGEKMYRTGDLAKWLRDGTIDFLGRMDNQLKIRGYRIEVGEIEAQLVSHEQVDKAIVIGRMDQAEESYLCAYVVARESLDLSELRSYLAKYLPHYMIPSYFVYLDRLPITSNGKIDRKALPEPTRGLLNGVEYIAPISEVEKQLTVMWQELLGVESIGTLDNFFEVGGHSLKAATLAMRIGKAFDVKFPLRDLFIYPTIKEQADYIERASKDAYEEIPLVDERDYYPVSSAQKRLYVLQQLEAGVVYNMPGVFMVEGPLDPNRMEHALNQLIERHESLRTSFSYVDEETVQRVHQQITVVIEEMNLKQLHDLEHSKEFQSIVQRFIRPFDLSKAPLLRVGIARISEVKHLLLFDMHHIISDGVSMMVLVQDIVALYDGKTLPELRIQYKDYATWQQANFQGEGYTAHEQFWLDTFQEEIPVLQLPLDYARPTVQSFEGSRMNVVMNKTLTTAIQQVAKNYETTVYSVLLAGYTILLGKYAGQEDIVVGTPVAGRNHVDVEPLIGMFINTIALRNKPSADKTLKQFMQEVHETILGAFEHQDYPLEELIQKLDVTRDMSRNPLFDTVLVLQNMDRRSIEMDRVEFHPYSFESQVSKFDLTFTAVEEKDQIFLGIEYCTKLFKPETVSQMAGHYLHILEQMTTDSEQKIASITLVTEGEKQRLIADFNQTEVSYPKNKTIQQLFEEQVERTPENIAVIFEEQELTYHELNEKANVLARNLRNKGVQPESIVGIMADRSVEMLVGMLGIVKAGGAYLPLDPSYPAERIQYMLEDCAVNILLTQRHLSERIDFQGEKINLETMASDPENEETLESGHIESRRNLVSVNTAKDLAYVIYTSGSTGKPKGVMTTQLGVVRLVCNADYVELNEGDSILQTGALVFDASTFEIWGAVLNGLTLVLVQEEVILDAFLLEKALEKYQITTMWLTSPLFNQLSQKKPSLFQTLTQLIVGGDVLSPTHIEAVRRECPELRMINGYGPTENTTFSCCYPIDREWIGKSIPIGRPIANSTAYILNEQVELQPINVPGELCVGGDGVARGYINQPELTAEKFIDHPFHSGKKLYRTGDLARWLPDGTIEYLGRIDQQVKIRGYRIEVGEIEAQLLHHETIEEALVVVKQDQQEQGYLCAYVVSTYDWTATELQKYLAQRLPEYMLPSAYVQLENMPLTINGKIDRKALPEPEGSRMESGVDYIEPHREVEKKLAAIWEELLDVERVGLNDHFFTLGGHSLKAAQLITRIQQQFQVQLPLRDVFVYPTLQEMAKQIEQKESQSYESIQPAEERELYPASSAQKRMYMMYQLEQASVGYNIPTILKVEGEIDSDQLQIATNALLQRHEVLRTSFEMIEGKLMQRIHTEVDLPVTCIYEEEEQPVEEMVQKFIRPFHLNQPPLMRIGLITLQDGGYLLMLDMHHIVSDGFSMEILMQEFIKLYAGEKLPELRIQYKDYAVWQQEWRQSEAYQKQEKYWLESFEEEAPIIQLPTDYPRPMEKSFEGNQRSIVLEPKVTKAIRQLAQKNQTTVYMVLLAAYNILLSKYSGQEDIVVGTPVAGRNHRDVEPLIGMFVNTLALRSFPQSNKTLNQFIDEVKESTIAAFDYQSYPLEDLIQKLDIPRDMSRNPLFDTMFSMQHMSNRSESRSNQKFSPYEVEHLISKFDLTVTAIEENDRIGIAFEYATKLFKPETVGRLMNHYVHIVQQMIEGSDRTLAEISLVNEDEKQQLLFEFNPSHILEAINDPLNDKQNYPLNDTQDQTLIQRFEEQVERTPGASAVVYKERELSYKQLNKKANDLATLLRQKGVQANQPVGLMVERSIEMVIGILAILKAGGAYLPIDPSYPIERIQFMLEDSEARLLLTDKSSVEGVLGQKRERTSGTVTTDNPFFTGEIVLIDRIDKVSFMTYLKGSTTNLPSINQPSDLAYIIYTSGTTGQPKGVMIEHRNVLHLIEGLEKEVYVYHEKPIRVALVAPYVFDASVQQLFASLLSGHALYIVEDETKLEGAQLLDFYQQHQIRLSDGTPAHLAILAESLFTSGEEEKDMQTIYPHFLIGGDKLPSQLVARFADLLERQQIKITNVYGPTECTVDATYYPVDKLDILSVKSVVPIGKPLPNVQAYIMDASLQLLPIGAVGELYLAGAGLARGYLNRAELTKERFIENPFKSGERMYRTGDLAKWLPDGNLEYVGRIDQQLKVRGYRIEAGEIEAQLLQDERIHEAVIHLIGKEANRQQLIAYYVAESEIEMQELRESLKKKLPSYMIPAFFVWLEKMPLTSNGKINRKALPQPEAQPGRITAHRAPENEVEAQLLQICQGLLQIETMGVEDDFFELGGDSLLLVELQTKIRRAFQEEIAVKTILMKPSVKELAQEIKLMKNSSGEEGH
jgi:tyrocidine synthetase-3